MHLRTFLSFAAGVAMLALAGCATSPHASSSTATPLASPVAHEFIPEGVYVSPPKQGNLNVAFDQIGRGERTFPNNRIGARLIFSSNLKMPKLEAVITSTNTFVLRIRFANRDKKNVKVSLTCTYADDDSKTRRVKNLAFPVNSYRDINIDFSGQPDRTLYIRATAVPY